MNKVFLTGRLIKAVDYQTINNKELAKFAMAVPKEYDRTKADFINVEAWGKTADLARQYLNKGSKVLVEGSIKVNDYEDNNGVKRYVVDVNASKIEFLDSKKADTSKASTDEFEQEVEEVKEEPITDDGLPF